MATQQASNSREPAKRRWLRLVAGFLALLLVLAVSAWFLLTDPYEPPEILGTDVAGQAERLVSSSLGALAARGLEQGRLEVGWAKHSITPPLGSPTFGYSARGRRGVERIADEVFARALALRLGGGPPFVFVTADICLWFSDTSGRIARETADLVSRERLYFGATHDHSGPGGYANSRAAAWIMQPRREALVDLIVRGAVGAIRDAVTDLSPGRMRTLVSHAPEFIENRMRPGDPLDDELLLVEYEKETGGRCAFVSFSAHATAIAPGLTVCSGDYPGALSRRLVEAGGYDEALFFASETGQAGPALNGATVSADAVEPAYELGRRMAGRLIALSRHAALPFRNETTLAALRVPLPLPSWCFRFFGRVVAPAVTAWLVGEDEPHAHVQAVRIGSTVYVGHSFEYSAVIARRLKEEVAAAGGRLWITSFNGDHYLYVVPEAYADAPIYESGMTLFGPKLGPYTARVTAALFAAMEELGRGTAPRFELPPR